MKEVLSSIFFLALAGFLLWGWNTWYGAKKETLDTRPSIVSLSGEKDIVPIRTSPIVKQETKDAASAEKSQETPAQEIASTSKMHPKDTLEINVLNGGAPKGSAAKAQDLLKKNGYLKSQAASAKGDYTGITLYFKEGFEQDAGEIQKLFAGDASVGVKSAPSATSELSSASVVVVLGK